MIGRKYFLIAVTLLAIAFSCKEDDDKYERPEWLAGKVYSQIKGVENLSTFAKCIEMVGYDSVIDVSGSYTVFAPTNEAFQLFFQNNPLYKSVESIPSDKLLEIVKYHIVQNPWSREQLRLLDVNGWIDPEDEYNNKPRGFKRETLLLKKDKKFGVRKVDNDINELMIIDTTETSWYRKVATDSRKFAPIFFQEYFNIYNLPLSDFSYYFDRKFDTSDDMFYVNGKLIGDEIFAENGFIHQIDRVIEPLPTAYEILSSTIDANDYSKFLKLVNKFPSLVKNDEKTEAQPGADLGLVVDTLYDLTYPDLTFDITSEKTKAPSGGAGFPEDVTIRFHHGLVAPTNAAFDEFVNQYIVGAGQWGSLENVPKKIQKIIANSYFSINPIYESDIQKGFYNGELDVMKIDPSTIVQKQFGSNSTFIGVNKPLIPRAFKSVTGPVYRQTGYSTLMNAIEYSGLISALKREESDYSFFVIPDAQLASDSSLFYDYVEINNISYESFRAIQRGIIPRGYGLSRNDLRFLLLNQVVVEAPKGVAQKEFLKTLAGNHIIWNNSNGTVQGTTPSIDGYRNGQVVNVVPNKISSDTDNGDTYAVNAWFNFSTTNMYTKIASEFPEFHALLVKAGLASEKRYEYLFLSENQLYTVFAPSKEALIAANASSLEGEELIKFLKMHFIVGDMIFTDGRMPSGYYTTAYQVPATSSSPSYTLKVYIKTVPDQIIFTDKNGSTYYTLNESNSTNIITARNLNASGTETNYPNIISTGVIHKVEKAIIATQLDVK